MGPRGVWDRPPSEQVLPQEVGSLRLSSPPPVRLARTRPRLASRSPGGFLQVTGLPAHAPVPIINRRMQHKGAGAETKPGQMLSLRSFFAWANGR